MTTATKPHCDICNKPLPNAGAVTMHERSKAHKARVAAAETVRREPQRDAGGRAIATAATTLPASGIPEHGLPLGKAMLKTSWMFGPWALGPLAAGALYGLLPPPVLAVIVVACLVIPIPLFINHWRRRFMPVIVAEINDAGDRIQFRTYYAIKSNKYGAEGRSEIFGTTGYVVDALGEKSTALNAFQWPENYETCAPESLRYLCDHTPSREKYRRKSAKLVQDLVNWGFVTLIIGLLAFITFVMGNRVFPE